MNEQWLSIVEYARAYDVSDMTIRRRIRNGKLKAVLREGKYYIPVHGHQESSAAPVPAATPTPRPMPMPRRDQVVHHPHHRPSDHMYALQQRHEPTQDEVPRYATKPLHVAPRSDDAKRLIDACEATLYRLDQFEAVMKSEYEHKIAALEANLRASEQEMKQLAQQVEDLQLLVKIVERR